MTRNKKRKALSLILSLAILGSATLAPAQTKDISRQLSPCIDQHTLAILQIDVTRIDIDALCDTIVKTVRQSKGTTFSPQDETDLLNIKEEPKQWQSKFIAAGGKTLCATWNTANPLDLLVAVPVTPKADGSTLGTLLSELSEGLTDGDFKQVQKDDLILLGEPRTLDNWRQIQAAGRPELRQATRHAGSGAIQLFLIPDTDTRRVIEALLPAVTEQRLVPEKNAIVRGFQWAALTVDLPPHPSLRLHIESADADSASALRDTLIEGYKIVAQLPQLHHVGKQLQEALDSLTPAVKDGSLELALDKDQSMNLTAHLLIPAFVETDQVTERIACGSNLSGIGKGILIYANDHNDKFPPSLETLVDTVDFPREGLACPSTGRNPDYSSYVYRGVDLKGVSCPPGLIVVHDRKGNHRDGRNVLFVDSHVDWVPEEEFSDRIERDNEMRKRYNYKTKPAE